MTIYLERNDPQKNMARYYRLIVAQTLFGEWALIADFWPKAEIQTETPSRRG